MDNLRGREVIKFLRRVFGGHGPSIYAGEPDLTEYDADTQNMILSSVDLFEHMNVRGENLESERIINHFFVGENADINRAANLFEAFGFLIGERKNNRLHVVEHNVLSVDWIEQTIPLMSRRAGEFNLDYNGWDIGRTLGPRDAIFIKS